MYFPHTNY